MDSVQQEGTVDVSHGNEYGMVNSCPDGPSYVVCAGD